MKDLRVGDKLEVEIIRITIGKDNKMHVTIKNDMFDNNPTLIVKEDRLVWKSESGRFTLR